jgi:hypothetical protein
MSLPTAFQPENCPSNRRPTGVPTAFQPPSKGVCSNPPIPPQAVGSRLFGGLGPPRRLPPPRSEGRSVDDGGDGE